MQVILLGESCKSISSSAMNHLGTTAVLAGPVYAPEVTSDAVGGHAGHLAAGRTQEKGGGRQGWVTHTLQQCPYQDTDSRCTDQQPRQRQNVVGHCRVHHRGLLPARRRHDQVGHASQVRHQSKSPAPVCCAQRWTASSLIPEWSSCRVGRATSGVTSSRRHEPVDRPSLDSMSESGRGALPQPCVSDGHGLYIVLKPRTRLREKPSDANEISAGTFPT